LTTARVGLTLPLVSGNCTVTGFVWTCVIAAASPLVAAEGTRETVTDATYVLVAAEGKTAAPKTLRVASIRLEAPPDDIPQPSTVLTFGVINEGDYRVTDVIIEIAIRERPAEGLDTSRKVFGPFRVAGHATIQAGYTVQYQLLLRNLPAGCRCVANVPVVAARELN
jgi:hypothetical protein